ncbi:MAG: hypothetical protein ACW99J_20935 [Candidatus Thorarchaeota archaeon]
MWLKEHAPVTMEKGKFLKDRGKNAIEFNLEGAFAKPFWDFAPDKQQVNWGSDNVIEMVSRPLNSFSKKEKEALDDNALETLHEMQEAVAKVARHSSKRRQKAIKAASLAEAQEQVQEAATG